MSLPLNLPSPAKLNLFLHITGRRADGYHNLQTVFQLLDYGDTISFVINSSPEIKVSSTADIPLEQNLIFRAARLLQEHTQVSNGAHINLEKLLPIGGGIGGGSSNAATTLLGLNHLWKTKLSCDELADLGKKLGADIPVFVRGYSAWGEGIGEELQAVKLPESWYLIIKPPASVSTAEIFSHPQLTRDSPHITIADFLAGRGNNDFEPLVRRCYPGVEEAFQWLSTWGNPRLTGTGSCVFITLPHEEEARRLLNMLPSIFEGFVSKGINRSPLLLAFDNIAGIGKNSRS